MYSGGSDLQIRGGGGGMERGYGHPDPGISGGLVSNNFFSAFRSSIWYRKSRGGGPPLDTPLMYIRFQTKTAQKPYPLGRHIPI